jgi:hypothetical protein
MTPIQKNFYRIAKLIAENRLLAAKQGAAYRAEGKLALARSYDRMASELADNVAGNSLQSLCRHFEVEQDANYKSELTVTQDEVQADLENVLRYVNSHRTPDKPRLMDEYILGIKPKESREELQKQWTEQFGEHSECPECGTACEMLYVEGQ